MTLSREEIGTRDYFAAAALTGLCANPGGPFQASAACGWDITNCAVSDIAKTAYDCADAMLTARTPAPVAPPAGKYEPRVGDFVTWGSCTAMWRVLRVDSGGVYAVLAEKRNYTTEPRYLDPSERETLRLATPSELAAAGLAVPPPATTPVPEVLTPDVPEGSTIAQLAAEQRASMGLTASMGSTQHFTHAATPAPEAKRPTHILWTGSSFPDVVRRVVKWVDGKPVVGLMSTRTNNEAPDEMRLSDPIESAWEPAPCPPPVAGSDVTPVAPWINDAANAIMREVKAVADPDDDLDDPEDYAALRGAIEGIIQRAAPTVRP